MSNQPDYYVYVYIDPRNHEEFYYGKGKNQRKEDHLFDEVESAKTERINEIRKEGLQPIIRVIARGLEESEAFLVEKTLLWKLGRQLTNKSTGKFAEKFRPHNKLHVDLAGFDYIEGVYYFNIGEGENRRWDDFRKFGFISAGQGTRWRDAICQFQQGDLVAAYLKGKGFVGIGRILQKAKPIREVKIAGKPLTQLPLFAGSLANIDSDDSCEYVALVHWISSIDHNTQKAHWKPKSKIFTTQLVRASLDNQPETIQFLEERFNIRFSDIRQQRNSID